MVPRKQALSIQAYYIMVSLQHHDKTWTFKTFFFSISGCQGLNVSLLWPKESEGEKKGWLYNYVWLVRRP